MSPRNSRTYLQKTRDFWVTISTEISVQKVKRLVSTPEVKGLWGECFLGIAAD